MKKVAKLLIKDINENFLLLIRDNHPVFGDDSDLPGGTAENNESLIETLVREVKEETQLDIDPREITEIYRGDDYSVHGTVFALFILVIKDKCNITLSEEHSKYVWISNAEFLNSAKTAKDKYMHMVYDKMLEKNI